SLFHLDSPSFTLVIRTESERDKLPQYDYWPPAFAVESVGARSSSPQLWLKRRCQLLASLYRRAPTSAMPLLESFFITSNPETILRGVMQLQHDLDPEDLSSLLEQLETPLGPYSEALREALWMKRRDQFLKSRRRDVLSPEHRFFLAL